MIVGLGVDMVEIQRIEKILAKNLNLAARILAPAELLDFAQQKPERQAVFLAKRFAAKEACAKAFGTGFQHGLHFAHIAISHDVRGKPLLQFFATAQQLCQQQQITQAHLSLSDERHYVVATVLLQSSSF
jgi:holo-[acyl-carrier protein] synthase